MLGKKSPKPMPSASAFVDKLRDDLQLLNIFVFYHLLLDKHNEMPRKHLTTVIKMHASKTNAHKQNKRKTKNNAS